MEGNNRGSMCAGGVMRMHYIYTENFQRQHLLIKHKNVSVKDVLCGNMLVSADMIYQSAEVSGFTAQ